MNEFILPDIGEGIVECELLEWLVKEGDIIVEDQPVAEVMTDKATVQIPAMHNGVVTKLYYQQGDIAKVHAPLFAMDISNDDSSTIDENETTNSVTSIESTEAFILPDIGEGIVECEIVKWCISEGDVIEEDQVVVEVMTDKAVVEIPAKFNGKVTKLHYQEGDIAKVHTALFEQVLTQEIELNPNRNENENENENGKGDISIKRNGSDHINHANVPPRSAQVTTQQGGNFEAPVLISGKVLASPAVRRLAREHNIALSSIQGTGKKGRVLKQDLLNATSPSQPVASSKTESSVYSALHSNDEQTNIAVTTNLLTRSSHIEGESSVKIVPIKGMRAAMAKQMIASVSTIPHFTVSDELCMDNLISLRAQLKPEFEKHQLKLSFMPFFVKSLSLALSDFPELNAHVNASGDELHVHSAHNIGIAVDSKVGLIVPNIKNVQTLSLLEVTKEINRLIMAARDGKIASADLKDGTISLSNIGVLGGITATPVINKPEVAIVALGKTQKLPRFDNDGNVSATNLMTLNWSGDHRVIDGATMVRFNNVWMSYLQNPEKMLVHLK